MEMEWSWGLERCKMAFARVLRDYDYYTKQVFEDKEKPIREAWASCCIEGKVVLEKITGLFRCTNCNNIIKIKER